MIRRLLVLAVVFVAAGAAACKDKEPYKAPAVPFKGLPAPDAGPAAPAVPAVPGTPERGPVRPLAVVLTADGSILVSARPGGVDLSARRVPGLVRVAEDGSVRVVRARIEPVKGPAGARESAFARLFLKEAREGSRDTEVPAGPDERPDLAAAAKADPELASQFFHRETLAPLAVRGPFLAWVAGAEGFQGGAHPYSRKSLVVVDADAGRAVDLRTRFPGRDLAAEVLGKAAADECVRKVLGTAPAEGPGGRVQWVVALGHEFESCAGGFRLAPLEPPRDRPEGAGDPERPMPEGLPAAGAVDWRASDDGAVAVLLMGLGKEDRVTLPWGGRGRADTRSRELRVWEKGMASPAVVGRVPSILAVQFLSGHKVPERVLAAFNAL